MWWPFRRKKSPPEALAVPLVAPFVPSGHVVKRVWIEQGCLICGACELTAPKVFSLPVVDGKVQDSAIVLPVSAEVVAEQSAAIEEAAWGCCVDVIKLSYSEA
jgi:ferredoxin